jgi:hypothetical protein
MTERATAQAQITPFRASEMIRHRVDPRDVPPSKAARRLHLTLSDFNAKLPELWARGFPNPDPTTGNYSLPAIDRWMDARDGLTAPNLAPDDHDQLINERIARL